MRRTIWPVIAIALLLLFGGCDKRDDSAANDTPKSPDAKALLASLKINEETPNILYTYMDDKQQFVTVETSADVPDPFRNDVVVVDLNRPPEERLAATQVVVADLNDKTESGYFMLKIEGRAAFEEALRLKRQWRINPSRTDMPVIDNPQEAMGLLDQSNDPDDLVVLYSASWCSYCKKAKRWLTEHKVDFVERDIETSDEAARQLQAKCKLAKLTCNGVPVIDYKGRIIPGFNPATLTDLMRQDAEKAGKPKPKAATP